MRMCGCVRCCRLGCVGRKSPQSCLLWEAVHPIRRHYTPSDRVHCDVTGAARRNGCSAAWPGRVERGRGKWSITKSVMKLVTDEVLHPIGKIQPLLIGLSAPELVEGCPVWFGRRLVEGLWGIPCRVLACCSF